MNSSTSSLSATSPPPAAYVAAMNDIEQRALRGELTLAQVRQEVFTVRERFAVEPALVAYWAARRR